LNFSKVNYLANYSKRKEGIKGLEGIEGLEGEEWNSGKHPVPWTS
jgi:hypothetical protein